MLGIMTHSVELLKSQYFTIIGCLMVRKANNKTNVLFHWRTTRSNDQSIAKDMFKILLRASHKSE